jgi:ATP-dependent DNA helicase RecG
MKICVQLKILEILTKIPNATRQQIAGKIENITEDGVKYNLKILKNKKIIKREGGRKFGKWLILD